MPPYRNNNPEPSARKTLMMLRKAELIELAKFLEVETDESMKVPELQELLEPAVKSAIADGITHMDFARILLPPQQPSKDKEEDEEEEEAPASVFSIQACHSPALSTVYSHRIRHSLVNCTKSVGLSAFASAKRRRILLKRIAKGCPPMARSTSLHNDGGESSRMAEQERSVLPGVQLEPDMGINPCKYCPPPDILYYPFKILLCPPTFGSFYLWYCIAPHLHLHTAPPRCALGYLMHQDH
jgi:hypothetical protein